MNNFVKYALDHGGSIHPLIVPSSETNGTGLMNPSVYNDDGIIRVIIRHVNYTFYHAEKKKLQHPHGPLTYLHPENDCNLRTTNYLVELDDDFNTVRCDKVDTSKFDTYKPQWVFVGLEDARLCKWENKYYLSGVRRDTTTNGEGRIEMSEIEILPDSVVEVSRFRIPTPKDNGSYCEKNWMPILNKPYHYVKWTNPTEVVFADRGQKKSFTTHMSQPIPMPRDLRGGSQVLTWGDKYVALTHETILKKSENGNKDAQYLHRFVIWDDNFNIFSYSKEFSIMDGEVEFTCGMCHYKDNEFLISFGFQDNSCFLLKIPGEALVDFING